MKKHILCLMVALVLLMLPGMAVEAEAATSGTCGEDLTWTLNAGTLTISGNGYMEDYRHYYLNNEDPPWYSLRQAIRSVVVEEGVTSIGWYAFYDCANLTSITIPDSVTSIGDYAFYYCTKLSSITIPESVIGIGDYAFYYCTKLSSITIPESVIYIGDVAFSGCDSLSKVEITDIAAWCQISFGNYSSNPLEYAENGLYLNGKPITNVVLPESVTFIPEHAFRNCTSLSSITIPESVTSIGNYAFCGCTSLSRIMIPDSVTSIGIRAFNDCASLSGIWVNKENPFYSSDDCGVLFDKDKILLMQAPGTIADAYSVPETVLAINDFAFENCKNLTSVTIPESVTSIGFSAFEVCSSLKSVTISEGVTVIDSYAFEYCSSLVSVTIPESVTEIGAHAFEECHNLTTVHYGGTEAQRYNIETPDPWESGLECVVWHYECDGKSCPNPFADVAKDDYYYDSVIWAVNRGITNGLSENTFGPETTCTRGQIVTFLWRANGSPYPETYDNPFWDVNWGDYFYEAVLWAVENGITSGMGDGSFAPNTPCTRGQVATFLWRACGQSAPSGTNIFTDIAPGAYYYDAVLWAVENGITNGMGDGTFAPDAPCTRGQIVTFLYRAMA